MFLNFWGILLFRDVDFLLGSIIGVIFALKNRKPEQSPLIIGIMVGIVGGSLSAIPPTLYICILSQRSIVWCFLCFEVLIITGLVVGSIVGLLFGYIYKKKDNKTKYSMEDEFYKDFIVQ